MTSPLIPTKKLTFDDYTLAWICPLPIDLTAARNMLDELHKAPPQPERDNNRYTFGSIHGHNIVIVCLGSMGITKAAIAATRLDISFRNLRFGLLVGTAGGVPDEEDIRLGDVVISKGDGRSGGVVAYDRGKDTIRGLESRPFLNGVPEILGNAFSELESQYMDRDSKTEEYLSQAITRNERFQAFDRPFLLADKLFSVDFEHVNPEDRTCAECDNAYIEVREPRDKLRVHFGIVASGEQVIKSGVQRAKIVAAHPGVIAIETEAAGLMDIFGCATIRGISSYSDSHKNDGWQKYAAAAAATIAKEVLEIIPVMVGEHSPSTIQPSSTVPFLRDPSFIGRETILGDLAHRFSLPGSSKRIAMAGLGGMGKSHIAIEYSYRLRERSPNVWVFWVHASTCQRFEQGYRTIADRLQLPGRDDPKVNILKLVSNWLADEADGLWLIILDNADDFRLFAPTQASTSEVSRPSLLDFLPQVTTGSILITCRTKDDAQRLLVSSQDIVWVDPPDMPTFI